MALPGMLVPHATIANTVHHAGLVSHARVTVLIIWGVILQIHNLMFIPQQFQSAGHAQAYVHMAGQDWDMVI